MPTRNSARGHKNAVLSIILVSYLMIILDTSIVITGLPRIQQELAFSSAQLAWVQSVYTLVFGGFLLLGARGGDILGRRPMYQLGLGIFTVASVAVALSQSAAWMVAMRGLQGLGAAILAPSSLALLSVHFPEGPERRRATALYGAVAGIGASVGLVLGGLLADVWSWRVGFFINLPVGLLLAIAGARHIGETARRPGHFDILGAVLSTFGFGTLIWGIVDAGEQGWRSPQAIGGVAVGLVSIVGFVLHEARAAQPIMPLRLFRHRERMGAYAARFLFLGAMVTFFFFTTQYMQGVLGFTALEAGLGFLPMTLVNFFVAMSGPRLASRLGSSSQLVLGLVLATMGMIWLSLLGDHSSYLAGVVLPMVLIGAGQGFCFGPLTASGIAGTLPEDAGAASGVVNVAHQLGSSTGLGVMTAVAVAAERGGQGAFGIAHGVAAALRGGSVLLMLAVVIAVLLILPARRAGLPRVVRHGATH
jgi:EmrB/QacA subfamily drug resistance transporter